MVTGVRSAGLLLGVTLAQPISSAVEMAARTRAYLINAPAPDVLRLAPPSHSHRGSGRDYPSAHCLRSLTRQRARPGGHQQ